MYICPECGTEYAVVPDACTVCGHEPADTEHIDLFAAAAEQERKAAEQKREQEQQYQNRAAAQQETAAFPAAEPRVTADSETLTDAFPKEKKKSSSGMKAAALCTAAAVVMGGGAYLGFRMGKPAGFRKSTVGTFYLKGNALWFQNGQTAEAFCLRDDIIKNTASGLYADNADNYDTAFLNSLLTVSPDGMDFYYPKQLDFSVKNEKGTYTLMHCSAEHPEEAEEIAEISIQESLYNFVYSYSSTISANSYLNGISSSEYNMNPAYLLCGDAIYYRNAEREFCCLRNGETEVIAPIVERYWTIPEQDGVYYITIPEYDDYKERMQITTPQQAFRPDYDCMNTEMYVNQTDDGFETQMHSADYALYRSVPGEKPERLIKEGIEDWKPISAGKPDYLYYTVFLNGDGGDAATETGAGSELRRFRFETGKSETLCSCDPDGRLILLRDYPDDCFYYAYCTMSSTRLKTWMPYHASVLPADIDYDTEMLSTTLGHEIEVTTEDGKEVHILVDHMVPMDQITFFYQKRGQEAVELRKLTDMYYVNTDITCPSKPYMWVLDDSMSARKVCVYYRGEEIPLTYAKDSKVYTAPDMFYFAEDGSRLIASALDYSVSYSDMYISYPSKTLTGILNGAEPVEMQPVAEPKDGVSVLTLELVNEPAEILRISDHELFSGSEKLASNVYMGVRALQPEYRQLCFIADEKTTASTPDSVIPMNTSYCGTLIRRSDRVSTIVAENVTDFIPADKTHFSVICGEAGKAGTLTICSENGFYQADTGVTALIGVRELTDNPTFRDVFFS